MVSLSVGARDWLSGAAIFAVAVAYHLLILPDSLPNDHFLQISGARQVLVGGELPYRDFVDRGLPFQYYLSALTMALSGESLFAEAFVCILFISAGVAISYHLSRRASGSVLIALIAVLVLLLLAPRHYNYQKTFFLPLGLLLVWRYLDRPTDVRVQMLSGFTAIAFLFRHDQAVYIGAATLVAVLLAHIGDVLTTSRRTALYGISFVLALVPFWLFVALNGGLAAYFSEGVEMSATQTDTTLFSFQPSFIVRLGVPMLSLHLPPTGGGTLPSISIPALADGRNPTAWAFWSFILWPLAAGLLVGWDAIRERWLSRFVSVPSTPLERTMIATAVVFAAVALPPLLRSTGLHARFPDVAPFCVVLGAWLLKQLWARRGPAAVRRSVGVVLVCVTLASSASLSNHPLSRNPLFGGPAAWIDVPRAQADALDRSARRRGVLGDYVAACTRPADKVLFTWFVPEMYFYTRRLFAAGQPYFYDAVGSSPPGEALMVSRMRGASVPIVLQNPSAYGSFDTDYPTLFAYMTSEYRLAGEWDPEDGLNTRIKVWVHRRAVPTGTFPELRLPCFA